MHLGANDSNTWAGSTFPADFERRILAVTYMQGTNMPAERMGVAHVACVRGCSCKRLLLTFRAEANTGIAATEVCHVDSAHFVREMMRQAVHKRHAQHNGASLDVDTDRLGACPEICSSVNGKHAALSLQMSMACDCTCAMVSCAETEPKL
jgi:hypothetical protein